MPQVQHAHRFIFPAVVIALFIATIAVFGFTMREMDRTATADAKVSHEYWSDRKERRMMRHFAYAQREAPDETRSTWFPRVAQPGEKSQGKSPSNSASVAPVRESRAWVNAQYTVVYAQRSEENLEQRKRSDALNKWQIMKGRP